MLVELGKLEALFNCKPIWQMHFAAVKALVTRLEHEHFSESFGLFLLFLHCELRLTLPKLLAMNQGGCKRFDREADRYRAKPLY